MILRMHVKTDDYRFLWLKYVTGFDPSVHCARCLRGRYSKLLPYRRSLAGFDVEAALDEDYSAAGASCAYLCGVTGRHANNLHIAFEPAPGEEFRHEDDRVRVHIVGARRLPIVPLPPEAQEGLASPFHTCRNYQFGWHRFGPPPGPPDASDASGD